MSPLSSLPPQQRAVLALILEKGKTYEEIAELLGLEVDAVRQRAHEALSGLAPQDGARPATRHRAAIGNYLLGQDSADTAATTYAYLERSVAGRDWAGALAAALAELAPEGLPEIPPDPDDEDEDADEPAAGPPESAAPAPVPPPPLPPETGPEDPRAQPDPAADPAAPAVSRRGGALLIGLVVVLLAGAAAAFLLLRGGSSHKPPKPAATATTPARLAAQITLKSARGVTARGFAAVIERGTQRVVAIAASGLQPTSAHLAYAVWLYNTRTDAELVGFVLSVKADGKISAAAPVPPGAAAFHNLVLTRESSRAATAPGQIVFEGAIPAGATG